MFFIYRLLDPRDHSICYVGMSKNAERRYIEHTQNQIRSDLHWWITSLKRLNLRPLLSIIEAVETIEEAKEREAHWIREYLERDEPLTNGLFPSSARLPGQTYLRYASYAFRGTELECEENKRQRKYLRNRLR